jgi:hypothetical protein
MVRSREVISLASGFAALEVSSGALEDGRAFSTTPVSLDDGAGASIVSSRRAAGAGVVAGGTVGGLVWMGVRGRRRLVSARRVALWGELGLRGGGEREAQERDSEEKDEV